MKSATSSDVARGPGARAEGKDDVSLAVHERDADLAVRLVAGTRCDRLPGDERLDDAGSGCSRSSTTGSARTATGPELRQPERLALVDHAVARRLEALAELVVDLGRAHVRADESSRRRVALTPRSATSGVRPERTLPRMRGPSSERERVLAGELPGQPERAPPRSSTARGADA
mgnify:CR=1 FL=1